MATSQECSYIVRHVRKHFPKKHYGQIQARVISRKEKIFRELGIVWVQGLAKTKSRNRVTTQIANLRFELSLHDEQ